MTWNYRIMRYSSGELGIHEVYYEQGKIDGWTKEPIIVGDNVEELYSILETIRTDIEKSKNDILEYGENK